VLQALPPSSLFSSRIHPPCVSVEEQRLVADFVAISQLGSAALKHDYYIHDKNLKIY
jgi:hypothetical protein